MANQRASSILPLYVLCTLLVSSAAAQATDLQADAVASWDFQTGSGDILKDVSGNGHHGRIVGAKWVTGSWGQGLKFDRAKRNYVSVPDSAALHVQPPYSLGVWFRTTSSQNNAVYLIKSGGTFTGCGVYYYGDSRAMYVDAKGVDKKLYHIGSSSKNLPNGNWHYAVATCGNGKQRLFVDGRMFAERDIPRDLTLDYSGTQGVQLGRWLGNGHFDGTMGKAYILKRALTPDEVRTLFAAERKSFKNNVTVNQAASRPTIDGHHDDACWKNQPVLEHFTQIDYDSSPPKKQTTVQLSFDDTNLYVAARCFEPNLSTVVAKPRPRDDPSAMKDDHLEFFLSPKNGSYYHLVLTAANVLLDRKCDYEIERKGYAPGAFSRFHADPSWNCRGIQTAVHKDAGTWSVEMLIPLSELGGATNVTRWRMNVARFDGHSRTVSSFSPLFQHLDQPESFSSLSFAGETAVLTRAEKTPVSVDLTPLAQTNYDTDSDGQPLIFANSYLRRGSYTTRPLRDDSSQTVKLFASLDEFEPATFSVRATGRELHNVRAQVSGDLKNARGEVIPASNIEIRIVELWRRQLNSRQHMYMERFLEKQTGVDIARHTTRRFWLTVHIPKQAVAGTYRTSIRITAGRSTIRQLTLEVEVLPLRLQQAAGMGYFMYLPTWGIPPSLRTEAYLKKIFVDMRLHGMTTATLYPYGLPFGNVMDVLRDSRLMKAGVPAIWLGADAVGPEVWKSTLDQAKKKNWPELALYLQDEPGNQQRIDNAKRLFAKLDQFRKRYPEHSRVRATTAIGETGIKALGSQYDIWIAGAGFDEKLVKASQQMDKLLWSYDCNLAPVDAESSRFYFGMWCWKTGIKGSALWAYADPGSTSSNAWDAVLKDVVNTELHYSFVRPTPEDLVPTIGWEAVREGIDDHRYLTTLSNLIRQAEAKGLSTDAKRAQGLLAKLTDSIDKNGHRARAQRGGATKRRMGNHYDRTSPHGERTTTDYVRFRRRLADEILRMRQVLRG